MSTDKGNNGSGTMALRDHFLSIREGPFSTAPYNQNSQCTFRNVLNRVSACLNHRLSTSQYLQLAWQIPSPCATSV